MVNSETLWRVRTLHGARGSCDSGITQRHQATCRGTSQEICGEPESARSEAKNRQAFRFGPRGKRPGLVDRLYFCHLAGDFGPRQALPYDLSDSQIKAVTVGHVAAIVEAECLLIQIPEQVERLHADVGSTDPTLQEAPEVLQGIGVDCSLHVALGVVNHQVPVVVLQAVVGGQGVGVEDGAGLNCSGSA